jgi:hypothetical protein
MPPRKAKYQNKTKKLGPDASLDQNIPSKAQAEEENEWNPIEIHGNAPSPSPTPFQNHSKTDLRTIFHYP